MRSLYAQLKWLTLATHNTLLKTPWLSLSGQSATKWLRNTKLEIEFLLGFQKDKILSPKEVWKM